MANKKVKQTIPLGDTIPGPGTLQVTIISGDRSDDIPSIEIDEENDYIGNGTAQDVGSTPLTPDRKSTI